MIKIFRKLRQRLLTENKFSKYLIYAIGEIILVVIGILIALQINNWNEERKTNIAENKALLALKNEFQQNINRLQFICEQRDSAQADKRAYYDILANDTIPPETKARVPTRGFYGGSWAVQNTVLNGLVNSGAIDNIKNDSLKTLLTLWPTRVQRWNDEEERWRILTDKLEDYRRTRIRSGIPKPKKGKWETIFKDTREQYYSRKALIVNDLEYQNFIASEIAMLYIQSIQCDNLMGNYQKIMTALNLEIDNRKIN